MNSSVLDSTAGMMANGGLIKINQEFRTDIFSVSKTHIVNRVLPRRGVRG